METLARPRSRWIAAVLAAATIAAGCGSDPAGDSADAGGGSAPQTTTAGSTDDAADDLDLSGVTLRIATQGAQTKASFEASGVLDDTPYDVEWAVVTGTTAVVQALLADSADIGTLGDFSLILAQANDTTDWEADGAPLRNVLLAQPIDLDNYPSIATVANAGIDSLDDIRGKRFAYTPGGVVNLNYLLTLQAAGLTPEDIVPVELDFGVAASALAAGEVDLCSCQVAATADAISNGASILAGPNDVGLPTINAYVARSALFDDPATAAAVEDLVRRIVDWSYWALTDQAGVEATYLTAGQQTPEQATASFLASRQQPLLITPELIAQEQDIADLVADFGLLNRHIDISVHYDDQFNDSVTDEIEELGYHDAVAASLEEHAP